MADTKTIALPNGLMAEMEKLAQAQQRSVEDVLADAVDRYVKDAQWNRLKAYGREKAKERNIKPGDVERLIAESRSEHGR